MNSERSQEAKEMAVRMGMSCGPFPWPSPVRAAGITIEQDTGISKVHGDGGYILVIPMLWGV